MLKFPGSGPSGTSLHYWEQKSGTRIHSILCFPVLGYEHVDTWPLQGDKAFLLPRGDAQDPRLDTRLRSVMADEGSAVFQLQAADGDFPRDYRRLTQLYCMNGGHHLQILPDGKVQGLRDDGDAHSKTAQSSAHFHIQDRPALWCVYVLSDTTAVLDSKMTRSLPVWHWRCVGFKDEGKGVCVVNDFSGLCLERNKK